MDRVCHSVQLTAFLSTPLHPNLVGVWEGLLREGKIPPSKGEFSPQTKSHEAFSEHLRSFPNSFCPVSNRYSYGGKKLIN